MKFTKATIASLTLPAGKSDHFEWDESTPGFGIRLRGDRRTWTAQIRANGRTRRLAIGDLRQIELEAARAAAKKFFAQATLGEDPAQARQEARTKAATTLGSVVDKYLVAREADSRANTHRHRRRFLKQYCAPLHGRPIDGVTRRDVALLMNDVAEQHGQASAKFCRSALSALYSWALKEGIATESNPVEHTNTFRDAAPRDRVLLPSEIKAIWHSLPNNSYGQIVRLLFYTACRRVEIGSLEWSEINFDKALLTIPAGKMKNHRTHQLPLLPEALAILRAIPRHPDSPYVFGGRKGFTSFSYCHGEMRRGLAATVDVAEHWGLHDIRRTIRSEMGDLGVEPWIGEKILAHTRSGIEATYNWAKLEKQMRQALQLWADRLRCIVDGTESTVVALRA
jgi:integrase